MSSLDYDYWLTDAAVMGVVQWLGLILGVGGLAIAIWQLLKTRKAAEAAELAVRDLKKSFTIQERLIEVSNASGLLASSREQIASGRYDAALIYLDFAHKQGLNIEQLLLDDQVELKIIKKAVLRIASLREVLDSERDNGNLTNSVSRALEAREIEGELNKTLARLRYRGEVVRG